VFLLKRLEGIDRPAIVTVARTVGAAVLGDSGANVDPKPAMLAQFGVIGAAYDRVVGRARPHRLCRNESRKGHGRRAAHGSVEGAGSVRFVGYVEGSDLFSGGSTRSRPTASPATSC
jgi:glycerol-3-phosphate acyltransferase PlsX